MAKPDIKASLRKGVAAEEVNVAKRLPGLSVVDRFAVAEQAFTDRPAGITGATTVAVDAINPESLQAALDAESFSVPLSHAHENPKNARQIYSQAKIEEMAETLREHGQLVAAPAIRHPTLDGHVILIDGHYRKRGLSAAGIDKIKVSLVTIKDEADMYAISFLINEKRNPQSILDNALSWKKMLDDATVADMAQIVKMTGISKATVSKTLQLLTLPEEAIERVRLNPEKFGVATSYELVQIQKTLSKEHLLALMDRIVSEDMSSRMIEQLRVRKERNTERKPKEVSRQYRIKPSVDHECVGIIREWDTGRVSFDIENIDDAKREGLVAYLRENFNS